MRVTLLTLVVGLSLITLSAVAVAGDDPEAPRLDKDNLPEPYMGVPTGFNCVGPWTITIGPVTICDPFMGNPPW